MIEIKEQQFLTRKEVAEKLRVSLPTLDRWIKDGWIKAYHIGDPLKTRAIRFKADEVESFLQSITNNY